MERLGVIETKIDELVRRVGIQNGRVLKSEESIQNLKDIDVATIQKVDKLSQDETNREKRSKSWKTWVFNNLSTMVFTIIIAYLLYALKLK